MLILCHDMFTLYVLLRRHYAIDAAASADAYAMRGGAYERRLFTRAMLLWRALQRAMMSASDVDVDTMMLCRRHAAVLRGMMRGALLFSAPPMMLHAVESMRMACYSGEAVIGVNCSSASSPLQAKSRRCRHAAMLPPLRY